MLEIDMGDTCFLPVMIYQKGEKKERFGEEELEEEGQEGQEEEERRGDKRKERTDGEIG